MTAVSASQEISTAPDQSQRPWSWYWTNARRDPRRAIAVLVSLLRGHWYKRYYRMRGIRFRAGSNFRVIKALRIRGPGEVIFGDNVEVENATPYTYDVNARIVVGDNVLIGATRFGCKQEIVIERDCILADASIRDTDFHSTHVNRRSASAPIRTAPVVISENVWVCQGAVILAGTRIGRNSVVGCGAVCARDYPENVIIMGNPAKPVAPVPGAGAR